VSKRVHLPGRPWVDEHGARRFICPLCGGEFVSDPDWTDTDREAEELVNLGRVNRDNRLSVFDECYPKVLAAARAQGLIE
jgi:hypothetical protein